MDSAFVIDCDKGQGPWVEPEVNVRLPARLGSLGKGKRPTLEVFRTSGIHPCGLLAPESHLPSWRSICDGGDSTTIH